MSVLIWSIAMLITIFMGHWVVRGLLSFFQPTTLPAGLPRAGMVIGFLERGLILSFLLLNQPSLIGFILTIKAIYRYGDIQGTNSEKFQISEYFIIGTLASVLYTFIIYLITRQVLGLIASYL